MLAQKGKGVEKGISRDEAGSMYKTNSNFRDQMGDQKYSETRQTNLTK